MAKETDAEFDARMEQQYENYCKDGSYEYVPHATGTYDFGDGQKYIRRKRVKNSNAVRKMIDIFKNDPGVRDLLKQVKKYRLVSRIGYGTDCKSVLCGFKSHPGVQQE